MDQHEEETRAYDYPDPGGFELVRAETDCQVQDFFPETQYQVSIFNKETLTPSARPVPVSSLLLLQA
jgi:hypothetical protein